MALSQLFRPLQPRDMNLLTYLLTYSLLLLLLLLLLLTTTTTATSSTHCDSSQQSLRHVGDDDANKEDDGIKPVVAEDEGNDKERDTEEDCNGGDNVNEMSYLTRYRCLADLEATCQVSNATHHRTITSVNHQTTSRAYETTENMIESLY